MNHVIEEIRKDHHDLPSAARSHLAECHLCRAELRMMERIENGIANLPPTPAPVPEALRVALFRKLSGPAYRIWHVVSAAVLVLVSPLLWNHLSGLRGTAVTGEGQYYFYGMCGLLLLLLLLPLTHRLLEAFHDDAVDLERTLDEFLEDKPWRGIPGAIRRRFGS